MQKPPFSAVALTFAGALPFLAAALDIPLPGLPRGVVLAERYGLIIACFMAGCHWGFAARRGAAHWYALSVVAPLVILFTGPSLGLLAGVFAGLLVLDGAFQWAGLAPGWWLTLRVPVSALVITTLVVL
ncbi:MAG: DUF3429 domain-containing protein [Pseudomonadota bacterium]